jgi:hypothetical protein
LGVVVGGRGGKQNGGKWRLLLFFTTRRHLRAAMSSPSPSDDDDDDTTVELEEHEIFEQLVSVGMTSFVRLDGQLVQTTASPRSVATTMNRQQQADGDGDQEEEEQEDEELPVVSEELPEQYCDAWDNVCGRSLSQ